MTSSDSATTAITAAANASIVKTAKKVLKKKKRDGGMGLDDLVAAVWKKNKVSNASIDEVKACIERETDKFALDNDRQLISLTSKKDKKKCGGSGGSSSSSKKDGKKKGKKRKTLEDDDNDESRSPSPHDPEEELAKSSKRIKVGRRKKGEDGGGGTEPSGAGGDDDHGRVASWRAANKIVLAPTAASTAAAAAVPGSATAAERQEAEMDALNRAQEYYPFRTFASARAAIAPPLVDRCTGGPNHFAEPSPIQAQAWPILSRRRDVVGIAETGSGKTLAFCLPALTGMMAERKKNPRPNAPPKMLVLSPTRELAMQTDKVLQEFGAAVGVRSVVLYGGVPKYAQAAELRRGGVGCVVATPGRIRDLIQDGAVRLDAVEYLVLDEADRMLDLGFEQDVRFIVSQCRPVESGRQTAMFSATWPAAIQEIAHTFMKDPIRVYVGFEAIASHAGDGGGDAANNSKGACIPVVDDSLSANKRVQQNVEVIDDHQRPSRLREILRKVHGGKNKNDRVLIFALYKKEAERLESVLQRDGWDCSSIHGNKNQGARTHALEQFKNGACPLLIATDVAARGLDIPNVEVVINYTFPLTIEDYVHRIGRTGRAGKNGISYTFFQPTDKARAGELQQVIRQAGQEVPRELLKFGSTIKKKEHKLYGNFGPSAAAPMKKATKITFDSDDEN